MMSNKEASEVIHGMVNRLVDITNNCPITATEAYALGRACAALDTIDAVVDAVLSKLTGAATS